MIGLIALCNKQGMVNKVIQNIPSDLINEGQNIRHLFEDEEYLDSLLQSASDHRPPPCLRMKTAGNPMVNAMVKPINNQLLFLAYGIEELSNLPQLVEMTLAVLNAPEELGYKPSISGYYEIQKLNNQLVNYQRVLDKTNVRLQSLLQETQEAQCTISVLERDALTALYTERVFYTRAAATLEKHTDTEFDIIAVDIEQFKVINDTFGSEKGDRLLMDLATCLLNIQAGDLFLLTRARADTFFALMPQTKASHNALDRSISFFLETYPLPMHFQIKIGVYKIDNRKLEIARMCDRALMAANSIKGNYNCRVAFFNDDMHERLILEQKISNTMMDSLQREEFHVYLQPKVEVRTGKVIGAEALVRWFHHELGMISPGVFIPVFEKNGFIHDLNSYVWEKTCTMLRNWKSANRRAVPLSVNVSRMDFYYEDLPETLIGLMNRYHLEPKELHLEITESAYVKDSAQLINILTRLRQIGFIIEMDDFGSGYSSLNTLSELPIDVLKLDLKFLIQDENADRRNKIMQLVINLAKELQLQVIAEGVETEEQSSLLRAMRCKYAQGYLYGRPMPEDEFLNYLPDRAGVAFHKKSPQINH